MLTVMYDKVIFIICVAIFVTSKLKIICCLLCAIIGLSALMTHKNMKMKRVIVLILLINL